MESSVTGSLDSDTAAGQSHFWFNSIKLIKLIKMIKIV